MTLKSIRDPILPILPEKEEFRDFDRLQRWWRGLLQDIQDFHRDVYDDLSRLESLPAYANNAAAIAGGLKVGDFYRTGGDPDVVCVVH